MEFYALPTIAVISGQETERGETEERAKWRKGEGYTLQTESCMPLHSETERGETEEKAKWRKGEGYRPKVVHTVT